MTSPAAPHGPSLLGDVARLAGVSPATVSRAFNTPQLLSGDTLERVLEAARRLDYLPYGVARSLRKRRSAVVGMIIPSLQNAYFAATVEHVQSRLSRGGYTMLLASSNRQPELELTAMKAMAAQGVDSVVVLGRVLDPATELVTQRARIPTLYSWTATPGKPSIAFDHAAAMAGLAQHLAGLGHRHIAVVFPFRQSADTARTRLTAIREALARKAIAIRPEAIIDDLGFDMVAGQEAFHRLRRQAPETTAVLCSNDAIAAGLILAAQAHGVAVPAQLSVTGYNDFEVASVIDPAITTVRTSSPLHAERLTDALLAWMATGTAPASEVLPTELVVRRSTGRIQRDRSA